MPTENEFAIQSQPDRQSYYRSQPPVRFSDLTKRWLVFSRDLIETILKDDRFSVHCYDRQALADRFGIPNDVTRALNDTLPLSVEGAEHRLRRERVARQIAQRSNEALHVFSRLFTQKLEGIRARGPQADFCLVKDLLSDPVQGALLSLAGMTVATGTTLDHLPMFFNGGLSLKKRASLEADLGNTLLRMTRPAERSEQLQALGLVIVSLNTLLGTLAGSVWTALERNREVPLDRIAWPEPLCFTSLPYIERVCTVPACVGGMEAKKGDIIRLFLDVATGNSEAGSGDTDLFFAAGMHKCLGLRFSKEVWGLTKARLAAESAVWDPGEAHFRSGDDLFNFMESARVTQIA